MASFALLAVLIFNVAGPGAEGRLTQGLVQNRPFPSARSPGLVFLHDNARDANQTGAAIAAAAAAATAGPASCPHFDEMKVVCAKGGVSVLQNKRSDGADERKLRFGSECAAETTIACKGGFKQTCPGNCADCACEYDPSTVPGAPYMLTMFKELMPFCSSMEASRVLNIGLGGGEFPMFLLSHCSSMSIEAVEIDKNVIEMAERYFGLSEAEESFGARLSLQQGDGLEAIEERATAGKVYDAVIIDCFGGEGRVPESCRSHRLAQAARQTLKPGGMFLQIIWDYSPNNAAVANDFGQAKNTYGEVFDGHVEDLRVPMPKAVNWVHVLKATKSEPRHPTGAKGAAFATGLNLSFAMLGLAQL